MIHFDRELSWVSFNERVLQEAEDSSNPLLERLKFLAIFSSNLDEFFRVRIAGIRTLLCLPESKQKKLDFDPNQLIKELYTKIEQQQVRFGQVFEEIVKKIATSGIHFQRFPHFSDSLTSSLSKWVEQNLHNHIEFIHSDQHSPIFLEDSKIYFIVRFSDRPKGLPVWFQEDGSYYNLFPLPENLNRFVQFEHQTRTDILFLDDALRFYFAKNFREFEDFYALKLSRDADLAIEDEFTGSLLKKIQQGLKDRSKGRPARFLYDPKLPKCALLKLKSVLNLSDEDLFSGGRYHNFSDLFSLYGLERPELKDKPWQPREHSLEKSKDFFESLEQKSELIHVPYQRYESVIRFFEEAASDEKVRSISMTMYRVAHKSRLMDALIRAAQNGKRVIVFCEIKARFDEASNLEWAERLEQAGALVLYSIPGLKVHAKVCLVERKQADTIKYYALFSTGNFNESNAKLYADYIYMTARPELTQDLKKVFDRLTGKVKKPRFSHLLVAQHGMKDSFLEKIEFEIHEAHAGRKAHVIAKMNALEHPKMVEKLYEAAGKGVKVDLIVRGINVLIPDSPNLRAISILDRYLEHTRAYYFYHQGEDLLYLASADWMKRNLKRRIEVGFPIQETDLKQRIIKELRIQLSDNVKARVFDEHQSNSQRGLNPNGALVQSQKAIYELEGQYSA